MKLAVTRGCEEWKWVPAAACRESDDSGSGDDDDCEIGMKLEERPVNM